MCAGGPGGEMQGSMGGMGEMGGMNSLMGAGTGSPFGQAAPMQGYGGSKRGFGGGGMGQPAYEAPPAYGAQSLGGGMQSPWSSMQARLGDQMGNYMTQAPIPRGDAFPMQASTGDDVYTPAGSQSEGGGMTAPMGVQQPESARRDQLRSLFTNYAPADMASSMGGGMGGQAFQTPAYALQAGNNYNYVDPAGVAARQRMQQQLFSNYTPA